MIGLNTAIGPPKKKVFQNFGGVQAKVGGVQTSNPPVVAPLLTDRTLRGSEFHNKAQGTNVNLKLQRHKAELLTFGNPGC
jgi:hypothetical protein